MKNIVDTDSGEFLSIEDSDWKNLINEHLSQWYQVKQNKDSAYSKEQELRHKFVKTFSDPSRLKGTEVLKIDSNWNCKISKILDYSLKKDEYGQFAKSEINKVLAEIASKFPDGAEIVNRLVTWKPELSVSEYNNLRPEIKDIIDKIVVTKPGSVNIELVASKAHI